MAFTCCIKSRPLRTRRTILCGAPAYRPNINAAPVSSLTICGRISGAASPCHSSRIVAAFQSLSSRCLPQRQYWHSGGVMLSIELFSHHQVNVTNDALVPSCPRKNTVTKQHFTGCLQTPSNLVVDVDTPHLLTSGFSKNQSAAVELRRKQNLLHDSECLRQIFSLAWK